MRRGGRQRGAPVPLLWPSIPARIAAPQKGFNPRGRMVYHSKKDVWLVALVSGGIIGPLLTGTYHLLAPGGVRQAGWSLLFIGVFSAGVVLVLTYPLYYEVTPSELKIRCGILVRQRVPLGAITEVYPTRNSLSAPAWSLDRLRVSYRLDDGERFALISPSDKRGFMRELVSRGAGLEMRGERVVRAAAGIGGAA